MDVPVSIGVFFVAQVAALCTLAVVAAGRAGPNPLAWSAGTAALLLVYLGGSAAIAATGWLRDFGMFPPNLMRLFAVATLLTIGLAFSPVGARLVDGLSLAWIVGYQSFRIAVEIFLFLAHRAGVLPVQMTFEGLNFDVLSGLSALVVAALIARGRLPRWGLVLWNGAGLALLATIVTIAVLSFPTPFRVFTDEPANRIVAEVPYVWLPLFLVQAALFGHLLVMRYLRRSVGAS